MAQLVAKGYWPQGAHRVTNEPGSWPLKNNGFPEKKWCRVHLQSKNRSE
jgi:hypothetical protein